MTPADVLHEHIRAFNDRDLDALMGRFTPAAEWTTGQSRIVGEHELREFFSAAFMGLLRTLEVQTILEAPGMAACEIIERLTHAGQPREFDIAGFYRIAGDRIAAAKIYREGSADLD